MNSIVLGFIVASFLESTLGNLVTPTNLEKPHPFAHVQCIDLLNS